MTVGVRNLIVAMAVLFLLGCGGGNVSEVDRGDRALERIVSYTDGAGPAPEVSTYEEAGLSGVNRKNLDDINHFLDDLNATDRSRIQSAIDTRNLLIRKFVAYASSSSALAPVLEDYRALLIGGVTAGNIADIDGLITHASPDDVDSRLKIIALVRSYLARDRTAPSIVLLGHNPLTIEAGSPYQEAGAEAYDEVDGNLSTQIAITGRVETGRVGEYNLTYAVTDRSGNRAEAIREVRVVDTTPPSIVLLGHDPLTMEVGERYDEPGYEVHDNSEGRVSVVIEGAVDTSRIGEYRLVYRAQDPSGNESNTTRRVRVVDRTAPSIVLLGHSPLTIEAGSPYQEAGAEAYDEVDGNLSTQIAITGRVETGRVGEYNLTYAVTDRSGNRAEAIREVRVVDTTPPSIVLDDIADLTVVQGDSFRDPGAEAYDRIDGNLTADIERSGSVDVSRVGEYTLRYRVADRQGNEARALRKVHVIKTAVDDDVGFVPLSVSRQNDLYERFKGGGTTYYVSSSEGDDGNDGLSQEHPWKTLHKVSEHQFRPGDNILFKRSDTFVKRADDIWATLVPEGSRNLTISAYGKGALPVFASRTVVNESWEKAGRGVWKLTGVPRDPFRLWIDATEHPRSVPGSGERMDEHYDWEYRDHTLYLRMQEDPGLHRIEFSVLPFTLLLKHSDHLKLLNLDIRDSLNALRLEGVDDSLIAHCRIGRNARNAISLADSQRDRFENILSLSEMKFQDRFGTPLLPSSGRKSTQRGTQEGFIAVDSSHLTVNGLFSQGWAHASINLSSEEGNTTDNNITGVYIKSSMLYGERVAFDGPRCSRNLFDRGYIDGIRASNQINGEHNTFRNSVIVGMKQSPYKRDDTGVAIALSDYVGSGVRGNLIEFNTFVDIQQACMKIGGYGNSGEGNVSDTVVRNNIFYHCGYDYARYPKAAIMFVEAMQSVRGTRFEGNGIYDPQASGEEHPFGYLPPNTDQEDYRAMNLGELEESDSDVWSAQSNRDADPDFVDYGSGDYRLEGNSVYKGTAVSSEDPIDFTMNRRQNPSTPGAYEVSP